MFDPLKRLVAEISVIEAESGTAGKLVFIGDYIDHGPSSKEVIDLARGLKAPKVLLAGNHEDMALRFIKGDAAYLRAFGNNWIHNGAADTYLSLCGLEAPQKVLRMWAWTRGEGAMDETLAYEGMEIPKVYERFLSSLRYSHHERLKALGRRIGFTFIHALPTRGRPLSGQRPKTRQELDKLHAAALASSSPDLAKRPAAARRARGLGLIPESIIWERRYDSSRGYGGEVVVHGHTPTIEYPRYASELAGGDPALHSQFSNYPADEHLPFLFSRSPGARYAKLPYREALGQLERIGPPWEWLKGLASSAWSYETWPGLGAEAINIDSGAVAGGALTALGLDERLLADGWLLCLICPSDGNQRVREIKVLKKLIKVNALGAAPR